MNPGIDDIINTLHQRQMFGDKGNIAIFESCQEVSQELKYCRV